MDFSRYVIIVLELPYFSAGIFTYYISNFNQYLCRIKHQNVPLPSMKTTWFLKGNCFHLILDPFKSNWFHKKFPFLNDEMVFLCHLSKVVCFFTDWWNCFLIEEVFIEDSFCAIYHNMSYNEILDKYW